MSANTKREKLKEHFRSLLNSHMESFTKAIADPKGDWVVKGFVDIAKNVYTISDDTKVISKILELLLFPNICKFAEQAKFKIHLSREQNHYPDLTFVDVSGNKFAVDLKTTYRSDNNNINGMTLGAFTGYFRERDSVKNITFPYSSYVGHFALGILYTRSDQEINERKMYTIEQLSEIPSVLKDFQFFVQEKYKIASDLPGSGNTKNIGSVKNISSLVSGSGPFSALGEDTFNDYWMYYLTKDMARGLDLPKAPYRNLEEYHAYKRKGK